MTEIQKRLFELRDEKYRDFNSKLIPSVDNARIIGVRTPDLRKFASQLWKDGAGKEFIKILPHYYFEENNIHAFLVEKIRDFDEALNETEKFLPYIDNWATCDMFSPKIFAKNTDRIYDKSIEWINSEKTYTVRYGIGMLMRYFLEENFSDDVLRSVADIKSDEYYVNMMISWFFATALAKQYDATMPYIAEHRLSPWCNNKTIQKATESFRISTGQKNLLRTYKIKTPV